MRSKTKCGQYTWAGMHGEHGEQVRDRERAREGGWATREEQDEQAKNGQETWAKLQEGRASRLETETTQETGAGLHGEQGERVRD